MRKQFLLLFYFVPWVTIAAKAALYLDNFQPDWLAAGVIFAAVLYMAALCGLAFQWGRQKRVFLWLLLGVMQYGVNLWSAAYVLAENGALVEQICRLLEMLSAILQIGLYFVGRREATLEK